MTRDKKGNRVKKTIGMKGNTKERQKQRKAEPKMKLVVGKTEIKQGNERQKEKGRKERYKEI